MWFPITNYKVDLTVAKQVGQVSPGFLQTLFIVYTHCILVAELGQVFAPP